MDLLNVSSISDRNQTDLEDSKAQVYLDVIEKYVEENEPDMLLVPNNADPIKCHKSVLTSLSSYLENMVLSLPKQDPFVLVLSSYNEKEIQCLIDFMYKGQVTIEANIKPLLRLAQELRVNDLVDLIVEEMSLNQSYESGFVDESFKDGSLDLRSSGEESDEKSDGGILSDDMSVEESLKSSASFKKWSENANSKLQCC